MTPLFVLIGIAIAVAIVDVVLRVRTNRVRKRRARHRDSGDWSYSAYAEGGALIDMGRQAVKTAPASLRSRIKRVPFRSVGDRLALTARTWFARNPPDFRVMARSAVRAFRRRDDGL
jgi:hypothetical protein